MAVPLLISYSLTEFADSRHLESGSLMPLNVDGSVYICPHCNQTVHRNALGEVLHHEIPNHKPLQSYRGADDEALEIQDGPNLWVRCAR